MDFSTRYRPFKAKPCDFFGDERILVDSSHRDQVDINNILKRYRQTGVLPPSLAQAVFADTSIFTDYKAALATIREAEDIFASMPAEIRESCGYEPSELLAFMSRPDSKPLIQKYFGGGVLPNQVAEANPAGISSPSPTKKE
ncbi:minor capsid protein [Capybara microvirus Cap1_SP_230]|nr:minor capsid protein [Capybara microvirus Cap1_SP_230]